nr:MAG: hypothetical protein D1H97_04500 [Paracoccus sp. BP8]
MMLHLTQELEPPANPARFMEAIWGFGTDTVRSSPHVKMDDIYGGTFEGRDFGSTKMQLLDHTLQRGKMVTSISSGMAHINMVLQRLNGRVLVQRFMDDATGRRPINQKRLRALGISDELHPRIQAQLQKHVDQTTGLLGRKVSRINIEKWDDLDARNAFVNGVDRWAKRSVQENDPGNMPAFMTKELGKTVFQFRSFMLAAYSKQLLAGVHHRDRETFSAFMSSMLFGGLFYAAQTAVNAQGRADRDEYLEKRLAPDAIARASFQRAGFSSILPIGVDFVAGFAGVEPIFDFRSSGLSNGGGIIGTLTSNPTGDLLRNLERGVAGASASIISPDYKLSQQDWRALSSLAIFQNAFIVRNGLAMMGADLPQYSQ